MKLNEFFKKAYLNYGADWVTKITLSKTPFAHQIDDLRFMGNHMRSGIYNEPGTGKTLPIQGYGLWLCNCGTKIIYLMPPILIPQFLQSFRQNYIDVEKYVSIEAFNGTPTQREEQMARWKKTEYPDILAMSYVRFVKNHLELLEFGYGGVIVDEATAVKNSDSHIHKAVKHFCNQKHEEISPEPDKYTIVPYNHLVLVTGTPIETNLTDAFGFISLITPGLYSSYRNFEYNHVIKETISNHVTGKSISKIAAYKELDRLHSNLYLNARRVLKTEVSDLPPRLVSEYLIDLTPKHKRLYDKLVNERIIEIGDELVDMTTAQSLYQAMQQVLLNPDKYGEVIKDNALYEALDSIIEMLDGEKIVVYAWFNDSVDRICERYKHLNPAKLNGTIVGAERENNKQKFITDPTCKMVVANPKSGGVGIDGFQHVCSHVVYAEVCPFIGTFQQSIDRLHRTGQKATSVNIYVLVANKTVAVKLRNDLVSKDANQEKVMKDKRAILADLQGKDGIQGELK